MSGLRWCAVGAAVAVVCYALGRAACAQTMPVAPEYPEPSYAVKKYVIRFPDAETLRKEWDELEQMVRVHAFGDPLVQRMRELVALDRDLEAIWAQGRHR